MIKSEFKSYLLTREDRLVFVIQVIFMTPFKFGSCPGTDKFDANGRECARMNANDSEWTRMDSNGREWTRMDANGREWMRMDAND
jgi:hypothetical protein